MNPFDVVSTRLYSQKVVNGQGALYSGVADCFQKTLKAEGLPGFFKGWTAHYLRLGPHTILTFILCTYICLCMKSINNMKRGKSEKHCRKSWLLTLNIFSTVSVHLHGRCLGERR